MTENKPRVTGKTMGTCLYTMLRKTDIDISNHTHIFRNNDRVSMDVVACDTGYKVMGRRIFMEVNFDKQDKQADARALLLLRHKVEIGDWSCRLRHLYPEE